METLNEMFSRDVRLFGGKPFIITDSETISYEEFDRRVGKMANVLSSFGVHKGEPVGVFMASTPFFAAAYWALQKIGAIPTPMSVMFREAEARGIIEATDMRVIITDKNTFPYAKAVKAKTLEYILIASGAQEGGTKLEPLLAKASTEFIPVQCKPDDVGCLFFTSGTTGKPKGVMESQLNLYSGPRNLSVYNRFSFGKEILINVLPLFNNFGQQMMNTCVYVGGTMVLFERWDTAAVLDAISKHKATFMCGAPTMYIYMLQAYYREKHDLTSLRQAMTSSAPISVDVINKFQELSGVRLCNVYGATETINIVTGESIYGTPHIGSVGQPFGQMKVTIVDDAGNPLPAGERGELRISGDSVSVGYWKNPEETARAFTSEGWLSGDIGYLDDEDFLYLVDRKKDMIISGGFNIYPQEIEAVVKDYPGLETCVAIGVPDDVKGQIPVLVVIQKPDSELKAAELIEFYRAKLSAYKCPRKIYVVDKMPVNVLGKLLRRELVKQIGEGTLKPTE